ncbi:MAG: pyrimidine 5'-nucleotidase [Neisseria sp.]|nr:pyrimidine 5'-nucleotidase [Neisseria sp.]
MGNINGKDKAAVWLFDLDNTLHNADAGIFQLINRRMSAYLAQRLRLTWEEADRLRLDYWRRYGATLAGLRLHHPEADVWDFLCQTHPMPQILPLLQAEAGAAQTLMRLGGRKAVFSNAPSFYVRALVGRMGLADCFAALFGTDDLGLSYKPSPDAYLNVCAKLQVRPADCIMVDDSPANLAAAKGLGMKTVYYGCRAPTPPEADAGVRDMAELARWAQKQAV